MIFMNYLELVNKIKRINSSQITNNLTFDAVIRFISYYITPLFYYLKMSPNAITYTSAITGFIGSLIGIIYGVKYIGLVILLFFIHLLIDYCDGNIARLLEKSTFHGRFIDGLFNILVVSIMQVSLYIMLFDSLDMGHTINVPFLNEFHIMVICLIAIALHPAQHFIYDRYSAHIRWVNDDHQLNIFPSIKANMSFKIIHGFDNLNHITLILSVYDVSFILLNFIIHILLAVLLIYFHIKYSYINMNVAANKNHRVKQGKSND